MSRGRRCMTFFSAFSYASEMAGPCGGGEVRNGSIVGGVDGWVKSRALNPWTNFDLQVFSECVVATIALCVCVWGGGGGGGGGGG